MAIQDANTGRPGFCTTQWTLVLNAQDGESSQSAEALEHLCRTYWYPLYSFARRKGSGPADAEDLVQGFFAILIEKDYLQAVDRGRGRFRTFILTAFSNFMSDQWARKNRLKRGGGKTIVSLDSQEAEARYQLEPGHSCTPDILFDRNWAETVVALVMERLEQEYCKAGENDRFEALRGCLAGGGTDAAYIEIGARLGLSENGVKTCARRMRLRFAAILRAEIRETLEAGADVDEEIRHLLGALV